MTQSDSIILISSRERVTRALATTGLLGTQILALGLLYSSSPFALLAGSIGMLTACHSQKQRRYNTELAYTRMAETTDISQSHAAELKLFDQLAANTGINYTILASEDNDRELDAAGVIAAAMRVFKKPFIWLHRKLEYDTFTLTVAFHEFAHVARNDARDELRVFRQSAGGVAIGAAVAGFMGLATAGTAMSAAALALTTAVPAWLHYRKAQRPDFCPRYELEADRVATELMDINASLATYTDDQGLAQHYVDMGIPRPAFLADAPVKPLGFVAGSFNRLCRLVCKPVTMPRFVPDISTPYGQLLTNLRQAEVTVLRQ